jgi:hypothetical protein
VQNGIISFPNSDIQIALDKNVDVEGMLRLNIQNSDKTINENVDITLKTWYGEANFNPWKNI